MRPNISCHFFVSSALATLFCAGVAQAWASSSTTTTTLTVTSSGNSVVSGGSVASGSMVTLTASVKAGAAELTTGQVSFCDASATHCTDIHLLGMAQLTSAGTAVLRMYPGIGSHSYKAIFAGTPNGSPAYAASTSSAEALTVTGTFPTTTTIAVTGNAGNYSLTATVAGTGGTVAPAGTVSFLDATNSNVSLGTVTLGAGTETLGFFNSSTPSTNPYPQSVSVADFNGDGKLDLFVPTYSTGSVLLGNGDGTFAAGPIVSAPGQAANNGAVADFNGDGKADIALSLPDANEVQVLLGNGDGTFTALTPIPAAGIYNVAVGDFNRDGKPDLIFTNPGGWEVTVLLGNGDGTFAGLAPIPVASGEPQVIAVGDFNGDGISDVAITDFPYTSGDPGSGTDVPGAVTILIGNGDGTFTTKAETPATGFSPLCITTGDFNGDGILDLAVANLYSDTPEPEPGTVTVLLGNGDGTFTATVVSPVTGFLPYSVAVGDVNGDGKADLVTTNAGSDTFSVLLGNGDGTFAVPLSPATGTSPSVGAVADFNGDGLADLAAADNYPHYAITVQLSQLTHSATATATGISPSGTGTHQVEASYGGDILYSDSTSSTIGLTAQLVKPTITVTPSASTITTVQPLVVTVAVSGGSRNLTPTGSVTLTSGTYTSAAAALAGGSATITVPAGSLATGADTLTASYTGDSNYAAATGTAPITVNNPSFIVAGTAVSVAPGATTGNTSTIAVTPLGGFTGGVALTAAVTSSPSGAVSSPTLSFGTTTPVSITGAAAGSATLTIATTASSSTSCTSANQVPRGIPWYASGGAVLACILLFGIPARRRNWRSMLGMAVLLVVFVGGMMACGGGGSGGSTCTPSTTPGTTAGSYTITVTGSSGSLTETGTVTLTVQ